MIQEIALWIIRILGFLVFQEALMTLFETSPKDDDEDENKPANIVFNNVIVILLWIAICIRWL